MRTRPLFSSARLRVFAVGGDPRIVTFAPYSDHPGTSGLHREGFGETFLRKAGIGAIHFVGRDNDWYQNNDMAPAVAAVREWAGQNSLTTYGSSMGGYAAMRFAGRLGARTAICLSPQFTVDPLEGWDDRWMAERRQLSVEEELPPPALRTFVVFDPLLDQDARHAQLVAQATRSTILAVPGGGHPVGVFLARNGLLAPMVLEVLDGTFSEDRFLRAAAQKLLSPRKPRMPPHPAVGALAAALGSVIGRRSKLQAILRSFR